LPRFAAAAPARIVGLRPVRRRRAEAAVACILVLGIGNSLLTDDGAGVHAVQRLVARAAGRNDVTILDAGTFSFPLLPALGDADALIAIDAIRAGGRPGELKVCEGEEFDRFVRRSGRSGNEVGLADLLERARQSGQLPQNRVLIGVEPEVLDWGHELSPPVAAALSGCVELALGFIERWHPSTDSPLH
jgi:hydrogenase maturation protease